MKVTRNPSFLLSIACFAIFATPYAVAQTVVTQSPPAGGQLQEIVVTATRRSESQQDVPVSITAVTAQELENQQISDVTDLAKLVPGMQVKPALTPMEITITIRGVSTLIPSINEDPGVGVYVDGVYNVINAGSNTAMVDMDQAEVLKGPQGTLFGRNTIGGAINITTAKPTDTWGGYVDASTGVYGAWSTTGVINAPIDPGVLDTRFVYQHMQNNGYGSNFYTGYENGNITEDYYRGTVKFVPAEGWEALGSAYYSSAFGFGPPTKETYVSTTASLGPGLPPTNFLIPFLSGHPGDFLSNYLIGGNWQNGNQDLSNTYNLKQYGYTGTVSGHISDALNVKSITGYIHTDYNQTSDLDGTPYQYLELVAYPETAKQFSEELQAFGDALDGRLKWITGLYYYNEKGSQLNYVSALPVLTPPGTPVTTQIEGATVDNTSKSVFAQVTYQLAPKLRLTAGARYVDDEREVTYHDHYATTGPSYTYLFCGLANAPLDPDPANCVFNQSVTYHYVPWTVGVDFSPTNDSLLYLKVSEGYRSGAYTLAGPPLANLAPGITPPEAAAANAVTLAETQPVAPERLLSPEIGGKIELLDRTLRINTALYYSDYDNIQLTQNLPSPCPTCTPVSVLRNSGQAHIWGGEIETLALIHKLELNASLGIADSKYVKVSPALPGLLDEPLINSSKYNGVFSAAYPLMMNNIGTLKPSVTYSYRSTMLLYTPTPPVPLSATTQGGFGLLDARITYQPLSMPLTLAMYGQNLTNKQYLVSGTAFAAPLNFANGFPGTPRNYGVSFRYNF